MIYAAEAEGGECIKFGFSQASVRDPTGYRRIRNRIRSLQTGCPYKVMLIAVVDWPDEFELYIHEYLREERTNGEWFAKSPDTFQVLTWMGDKLGGPRKLKQAMRERKQKRNNA